jgi:hypothetical protein
MIGVAAHHGQEPSKHPEAGKAGMAEYRAYTVGTDGHFIGFTPLVCTDDADAIEQAKQLLAGLVIEVWSGERMVTRLGPKKK